MPGGSPYKDTLGGRHVKGSTVPSNGQALVWDDTNKVWAPGQQQLTGTATYDPVLLAAGAFVATTVTVTGAAAGDVCYASHDQMGTADIMLSAHVQSANTVRVIFFNCSAGNIDIASGTLRVKVLKAT